MSSKLLGEVPAGGFAREYSVCTPRARLRLMDFGATLLGLEVPDASGEVGDVLLGLARLEDYFDNPACHGATIGPVANRTDGAELTIAGTSYRLEGNDGPDGRNNLHSSLTDGLHKRLWDLVPGDDPSTVELFCELRDGELGLPGNRRFTAEFSLVDLDADTTRLTVTYGCETDEPTFVNMTNHSYFDLGCRGGGSAMTALVEVEADEFIPLREDSVSEGDPRPVDGTPFDFREAKPLGRDIDDDCEQLRRARGYDHCLCIRGWDEGLPPRPALRAVDPEAGRTLEIRVTTPGAHLYTGNWLDDGDAKGGRTYGPRAGFAFEPEFYPDCPHHPAWPQPVCTPDRPYKQTFVYLFGTVRP